MKINKTLAMAGIVSLAAASSAFAAATTFETGSETVGTPAISVKPSKNVKVVYLQGTTAAGSGWTSYSISSFHNSGTKLYASSSGDTKIFMKDATAVANPPAAPAAGATMDNSGYTAL